jgi:hypothetical protein
MYTIAQCILAGLSDVATTPEKDADLRMAYELGWLASTVGTAISSELREAKKARNDLRAMRDNGRRLLRAADEREKAAAAPRAICGNAATSTPCEGTNIRDCAGCMVGNFLSECEA